MRPSFWLSVGTVVVSTARRRDDAQRAPRLPLSLLKRTSEISSTFREFWRRSRVVGRLSFFRCGCVALSLRPETQRAPMGGVISCFCVPPDSSVLPVPHRLLFSLRVSTSFPSLSLSLPAAPFDSFSCTRSLSLLSVAFLLVSLKIGMRELKPEFLSTASATRWGRAFIRWRGTRPPYRAARPSPE
jgi:hypothetical protein